MDNENESTDCGLTFFICGEKPVADHRCDTDGPFLAGGDNVPTVLEAIARGKAGYTWVSATCSQCGKIPFHYFW